MYTGSGNIGSGKSVVILEVGRYRVSSNIEGS